MSLFLHFLPKLATFQFISTRQFSLWYYRYHPGRIKANICFLQDIWSQSSTYFKQFWSIYHNITSLTPRELQSMNSCGSTGFQIHFSFVPPFFQPGQWYFQTYFGPKFCSLLWPPGTPAQTKWQNGIFLTSAVPYLRMFLCHTISANILLIQPVTN